MMFAKLFSEYDPSNISTTDQNISVIFIFHSIALSNTSITSLSNPSLFFTSSINSSLQSLFHIHGVCIANHHHAITHVVNVVNIAVAKKFFGFQSASNPPLHVISNLSLAHIFTKFHAVSCIASCIFSSKTSDPTFFKNNFHTAFKLCFDSVFNISLIYVFARFFHNQFINSFELINSSHDCNHALTILYSNA